MAYSARLKLLEAQRGELVARNDRLRHTFAERGAELTASAFWIEQGFSLAQRLLPGKGIFATALSLFRKFRG